MRIFASAWRYKEVSFQKVEEGGREGELRGGGKDSQQLSELLRRSFKDWLSQGYVSSTQGEDPKITESS